MKRHTCLYLLLAGLLLPAPVAAQRRRAQKNRQPAPRKEAPAPQTVVSRGTGDTTIRSTTLEVYQVYKPEIKPAPKTELTPTLPPAEVQRVPQQYEVPQQTLYYTYRSLPLKPLALGRDTTAPPEPNYVKAGGGNLSTIYADAGIGGLRGRDWTSAIHLQHLSQNGNLAGQQYWHTGLDATGTVHRNGHAFTGALDAHYRQYGLYGYDHEVYTYDAADIRRTYFGAGLQFDLQNEAAGIAGLDYHPVVRANFYTGNAISGEQTIDINLPVSKQIDTNLTAELGVHGIFTHFRSDWLSQGNNIFQLTPAFTFQSQGFRGHFGLSPTFGKGGVAYLLPDITATYQAGKDLVIKAGWQAQLIQNTYQQLTLKNPFITNILELQQMRSDEVFVDAAAGIGSHFSLSARVSWWQYDRLPLYLSAANTDGRTFVVTYDPRVNALSLQAAARYQIADIFSLGVSGAWYSYYNQKNERVYQEPAVRIKSDLQWQLLRDLQFNAYASLLDRMYARSVLGTEVKLNGVLDIGLGAEYRIVPRLSFWLNIGNLLDRRNERWLGYPEYGFNIFGGAKLRF